MYIYIYVCVCMFIYVCIFLSMYMPLMDDIFESFEYPITFLRFVVEFFYGILE